MKPLLSLMVVGAALAVSARSQDAPKSPGLADLKRFDLKVVHWEGSFGAFLLLRPDSSLMVDLAGIGSKKLTSVPFEASGARVGHLDLAFLKLTRDEITGDPERRLTRRVILAGRRRPESPERTIMDLTIQWDIEHFEEVDGRRVKQTSNTTHVDLRLHTVRDDDTIREYGRARVSHPRND